jgi:hypothetical protein
VKNYSIGKAEPEPETYGRQVQHVMTFDGLHSFTFLPHIIGVANLALRRGRMLRGSK